MVQDEVARVAAAVVGGDTEAASLAAAELLIERAAAHLSALPSDTIWQGRSRVPDNAGLRRFFVRHLGQHRGEGLLISAALLHLVLDTNALGTDPPLNKLEHRILLDAHRSGTIALVVPQLTLREAVNTWRAELQSRLAKLGTAYDDVRKIAPDLAGARRPPRHVDIEEAARSLLRQLAATLEAAGVAMPPSPEVAHDELIDLALARRQPFDKDGGGYRDALLWNIVVELAVAGQDVALISGDKAAFAFNRNDSTRLAQPLLDDLARIGATGALYPTSHAAVEALGLVAHEAIAATAAIIARNGPAFPEAVRDRLVEDLMGPADIGIVASLGNPFAVLHVSLGVPHQTLDLTVSDARRTETGQLESTVKLAVRQFVTVYIPWELFPQWSSLGTPSGDDDTAGVEINAHVVHLCRLVLDPLDDSLVAVEHLDTLDARLDPPPRSS